MKVIYIMGAGHIGSTVLDVVISTHPHMESLGEVLKFYRSAWLPDENRHCACGLPAYECPFWTQVRQKWIESMGSEEAAHYIHLQERFERSRSSWARLLWNRFIRTSDFNRYIKGTEALFKAIQEVGGKKFLVDSSLIPKRAYALSMLPNIELYLIHMVRDGRGVIWSLMKPGKQIPEKVYVPAPPRRTTKYWISANLQSAWVFRHVRKNRRQLIRYEDFVINTPMVLDQIGEMIGEDLSGLVKDAALTNPNEARHTVGGNRIRFQKDKDIRLKADFAWMEHLPAKDRQMFWRLAGWLARQFGYKQNQVDYR